MKKEGKNTHVAVRTLKLNREDDRFVMTFVFEDKEAQKGSQKAPEEKCQKIISIYQHTSGC